MASGHRVVVVGAGIVGASVAFHLADAGAGAEVVLVDDRLAGAATAAGAGIVARPWRDPGSAIHQLRSRAVDAYPSLAARVGATLDVIGELYVAAPGPAFEEAHEALAAGVGAPVRRLEPDDARAAFPYLSPELVSGAAELVVGAGGVEAVRFGGRRHPASIVVVAAGAWSAGLVAPAGVSLAVAPQRGQILHLAVSEDTARMPVVQPIGADHYLVPFADWRVVVGATRETGSGFDPRLTAAGVATVLADALRVAPGLAGATVRELRVGLRPASPDGDPMLGAVPGCPGLWIATGMGPQGLTLGPYCGSLVADAVLGRPADTDLAPFAPLRHFS
jgi:D-amino-acid dehydrogenase